MGEGLSGFSLSQALQSLAVLHLTLPFQYAMSSQLPGHAALVLVLFELSLRKHGAPEATSSSRIPKSGSAGLGR